METIDCDVLVVGGGPAGSSAARAASLNEKDVVIIEKKSNFKGRSCAEGIGSYLLPLLPFDIPKEYLKWRIDGIKFSTENFSLEKHGGFYSGWSVERRDFDEWLLSEAKQAGARILRSCKLEDIRLNAQGDVVECICQHQDKRKVIKPSKVIAADGSESILGEELGIYSEEKEYGYAHAWEMTDLKLENPHLEQIFIGDFAPGAYGFVFPKSSSTANVGVGTTDEEVDLEKQFKRFVNEIIPEKTRESVKRVERSGKGPFNFSMRSWRKSNVIFVGDAANQNFKPYIEGIIPAIICGDIAGKCAGKDSLKDYEEKVKKKLGDSFHESDRSMENLYFTRKLDGKRKHALQLYLFVYPDARSFDLLKDEDGERIKKAIIEKNSWSSKIVEKLAYIHWVTKLKLFRRDKVFLNRGK